MKTMTSLILLKNQLQPILNILHITTKTLYFSTIGKLVITGNSVEQIRDFTRFPLTTDLGNLSPSMHYTVKELSELTSEIVSEVSKEITQTIVSDLVVNFLHSASSFWEWIFRLPLFAWKMMVIVHNLLLAVPGVNSVYTIVLIVGGVSFLLNLPAFCHLVFRGLKQGFTNFFSFFSFVVVSILQIQKATIFNFLKYLKDKFLCYLKETWPTVFAVFERILNFFQSVIDSVKSAISKSLHWISDQVESFFNFLEYLLLAAKDVQGVLNQLKSICASLKQWSIIQKGLKNQYYLNPEELLVFNDYRLKLFKSNLYTVDDPVVLKTFTKLTDHEILKVLDEKLSFEKVSELLKENTDLLASMRTLLKKNQDLVMEKSDFSQKTVRLENLVEHFQNCLNLSSSSRDFVLKHKLELHSMSDSLITVQNRFIKQLLTQNEELWSSENGSLHFVRAIEERTLVLTYLKNMHQLLQEFVSNSSTSELEKSKSYLEHYVELQRVTTVLGNCNENLEKKLNGVSDVGFVFPYECYLKTFSVTNTMDKVLERHPSLATALGNHCTRYPSCFSEFAQLGTSIFSLQGRSRNLTVSEGTEHFERMARGFGASSPGASGLGTSGPGASGSGMSGFEGSVSGASDHVSSGQIATAVANAVKLVFKH